MTILDEIFAHKREEVDAQRKAVPLEALRERAAGSCPPIDFIGALRGHAARPALIAEVKHASPSRGLLIEDFDPVRLARAYAACGAAAISVLTDERYFQGGLEHLRAVRAALPAMPLLRKDFICDPYQIYQARAAGADALLLIAGALSGERLRELHVLAGELGMAALVEVHDEDDLVRALSCSPRLVGINNRDLRDFSVDLQTTLRLLPSIPEGVCVVAESGIQARADVQRLAQAKVDAILVGEAFVTAPDVQGAVRALMGEPETEKGSVAARRVEARGELRA